MTRLHPYHLLLIAAAATIKSSSLVVVHGFQPSGSSVCSRRESINNTFTSILGISSIVASATAASPPAANAIQACPPGSKNCVRQTWTPPSSTSSVDAISQLRSALNSYPQGGLEDGKVDGGGYTIISDTLDSASGSIVMEYRSSGKGTFAKLFNGGKPFVDDLVIESPSSKDGKAFEFRSASRLGDSDFGVNGKRLGYIGGLLKEKGWSGMGIGN